MRVLFWGTPEFAMPPLRALIGEGFDVVGVVTQPDKPQGRARRLTAPPVKELAVEEAIPCFQPATPKEAEFQELLEVMKPDISIVVAYGNILPTRLIDLPRLGTLNIHASLLPALRGAAPIQAAIRHGHRESGVSVMRVVKALDAGPVILSARTPILEDETYGELQLRLSELGALTLLEALALISIGEARETPQDDSLATYAPKITRDDALIDWSLGAAEIARWIRAYDPRPGAFTTLKERGADVKLYGAKVVGPQPVNANAAMAAPQPGEVLSTADGLVVACGEGAVRIVDVQPSGKGRMSGAQWARGRGIAAGDRFAS